MTTNLIDNNADKRKIGLFSCLLFGMAMLLPIAPVPVYGVIQPLAEGHMAIAYLLAAIPMTFTAWSFGVMGAKFPRAGSSYTFTANSINQYLGFTVGWTILLDYGLFPLLNYVVVATFIRELFPALPFTAVIVALILIICVVNLLGIKSIASVKNILTLFGFLVVIYFCYSAIIALKGGAGLGISTLGIVNPEHFTWSKILTGASIACFSYIGFDAITTLAEDVKEPAKNLPKATIFTCLIMTAVFFVMAWFAQCLYPDFTSFTNTDAAFIDAAKVAGGQTLANAISLAMIAGGLAFSLDMMAGVTRLLFGMGRDSVLPKKFFGYTHPKTGVPVYNVLLVTAFCLCFTQISLGDLIPIINFGGLLAFICVNLSVVMLFYFKEKVRGGFANSFKYLIAPGIGFLTCLTLWLSLPMQAKLIGGSWLLLGIIYVAIWSKGFKKPITFFQHNQEL